MREREKTADNKSINSCQNRSMLHAIGLDIDTKNKNFYILIWRELMGKLRRKFMI